MRGAVQEEPQRLAWFYEFVSQITLRTITTWSGCVSLHATKLPLLREEVLMKSSRPSPVMLEPLPPRPSGPRICNSKRMLPVAGWRGSPSAALPKEKKRFPPSCWLG